MAAEEIALAYGGTRSGNWWKLRCPCHDDHRPSLSIRDGGKHGLIVKCHAGCPRDKLLSALGVVVSQAGPLPKDTRGVKNWPRSAAAITPSNHLGGTLGAEEAIYDYADEIGAVLYQVLRYAGKAFRQRRPDGRGGWIWNSDGTRRVLYNLPTVLAAIKASQAIYVCEGEKDCDNLTRLGLVATTNSGGAGKWLTEYSESLRGSRVVILPDNDEVGRKHGQMIAAALHGVAKSVHVLELPDLPPSAT